MTIFVVDTFRILLPKEGRKTVSRVSLSRLPEELRKVEALQEGCMKRGVGGGQGDQSWLRGLRAGGSGPPFPVSLAGTRNYYHSRLENRNLT